MEKILSVYKTYDAMEADLVKAQLEDAGIICFLKSDNGGGTLPQLTLTNGIDVMVSGEDEKRALEIIENRVQ